MKRSIFGFSVILSAMAVSFYLATSSPLFAQDDEISRLRQRVTELEEKVKELELLLNECSDALKEQKTNDYGWQNKMNWRRLEVGMTESQVRETLGEPVKVIKGIKTLWYYPNFYGGYVSFDENGNLTGWNEP